MKLLCNTIVFIKYNCLIKCSIATSFDPFSYYGELVHVCDHDILVIINRRSQLFPAGTCTPSQSLNIHVASRAK